MHNEPSYEQIMREERLLSRIDNSGLSSGLYGIFNEISEREKLLTKALTYCYKILSSYDITDEAGNKIISDEKLDKILKVIKNKY